MRQVILVCGPPCAGKTAFVQRRARPGDVVLDQDVIGVAGMREGLAQVAAMADGTAWVIRCAPGPAQRKALARRIRATDVVLLVPERDELTARATRRPNSRRAIAAIGAWFRVESGQQTRARRPAPPARQPAPKPPGHTRGRKGRPWRDLCAQVYADPTETHCLRCGGWVDKSLPPRTRWSKSVDHKVPLIRGGPPLARSNVAIAHYGCNSRHGAQLRWGKAKPNASTRIEAYKPAMAW